MSYQLMSTVLDDQTILTTYNHEKLNVPFRIQIKRVLKPNPQMGDFFNFEVKELNLDVERTISEGQLHEALSYFGNDISELSLQLFAAQDGLITTQSQYDKVIEFSNANLEYKEWQIKNNGLTMDQVDEENWIQFLLSDFCFFMAESLVQLYERS